MLSAINWDQNSALLLDVAAHIVISSVSISHSSSRRFQRYDMTGASHPFAISDAAFDCLSFRFLVVNGINATVRDNPFFDECGMTVKRFDKCDSWSALHMAILQFQQQASEESSDEPFVLEIFPQSNAELLVIHRHARPVCERMALQLTPIGLQVMYKLVEVLRNWPQSLPQGPNCFSIVQRHRNGEFLERLLNDVHLVTGNFTTMWIDEGMLEDLQLPGRLVHAILLMNATPCLERQREECLICGLPVEKERRAALLPTDLEVRATNSSCSYWVLMGISLNPGFLDGVFKLCPDHEWAMNKEFYGVMIRDYYTAN